MTFKVGRALRGAAIGLAGHLLAIAAGFIAGRVVQPSVGGGFEDVAAVALTFLGIEALTGLGCLVGGAILIARGRRELGLGVIVGWLIGLAAVVLFVKSRS